MCAFFCCLVNATDILILAESFQNQHLVEMAIPFVRKTLNLRTVLHLLTLSYTRDLPRLQAVCLDYLTEEGHDEEQKWVLTQLEEDPALLEQVSAAILMHQQSQPQQ